MPTNVPEFITSNSGEFGSTTVTLGGNGMTATTYYAEDTSANTNTNVVKLENEVGKTRAAAMVVLDREGSMTLQLPSTASLPVVGATGSLNAGFSASGSAVTIRITSVSNPRSTRDFAKVSVNWLAYD